MSEPELEIPVTQFRAQLSELIDQTVETHTPIHLTRNGKRVVTLIASDNFELLMERAENWLDHMDVYEAGNDPDTTYVTWDDLAKELGWEGLPSALAAGKESA